METEGDYIRLGCDRWDQTWPTNSSVLSISADPLDLNRIGKREEYQSNVSRRQEEGGQPVGDLKILEIFWPPLITCHKLGDLTVMQLSHENVWAPLEFTPVRPDQVWKIVLFRGKGEGGAKSCIQRETTLHRMLWIVINHLIESIHIIYFQHLSYIQHWGHNN